MYNFYLISFYCLSFFLFFPFGLADLFDRSFSKRLGEYQLSYADKHFHHYIMESNISSCPNVST